MIGLRPKRCVTHVDRPIRFHGKVGQAAGRSPLPRVSWLAADWSRPVGRLRLLPTNQPAMSVQALDVDNRVTPPPALPDVPRKWNWTEEENRIILANVQRHGTQWDLVAAQLPGRTADAVRNHCHRLQRSSLYSDGSSEDRKTSSGHGRTVWTAEDDRISHAVGRPGRQLPPSICLLSVRDTARICTVRHGVDTQYRRQRPSGRRPLPRRPEIHTHTTQTTSIRRTG